MTKKTIFSQNETCWAKKNISFNQKIIKTKNIATNVLQKSYIEITVARAIAQSDNSHEKSCFKANKTLSIQKMTTLKGISTRQLVKRLFVVASPAQCVCAVAIKNIRSYFQNMKYFQTQITAHEQVGCLWQIKSVFSSSEITKKVDRVSIFF